MKCTACNGSSNRWSATVVQVPCYKCGGSGLKARFFTSWRRRRVGFGGVHLISKQQGCGRWRSVVASEYCSDLAIYSEIAFDYPRSKKYIFIRSDPIERERYLLRGGTS